MNQIYLYRLHIITLFFLNPPHPFQFQLPQNSTDPGRYKWLTFGCMVMEYKGWKLGSTSDSPSAVWSWNTKGEDLAVQVTHFRLYRHGIQRVKTWQLTHLRLYGHGIQRVRTWQYKWLTFSCMVMEYKGWGLGSTSDSPSAVWSWNTKGEDLAVQVTHLQLYGHGIQRVRTWQYKWLTFSCMVMEYKGWGLGSTSDSPSAVWSWNTKGEDLAVQVTHLQLYGHGIQRVRTWQYKWLTFSCMVMEYKGWGLGSTSDSPSAVWSWNTKGEDLAVQVTHLQLYGHGIQRVRTWQYKWLTFSCMVMEYKGWGLGSTSDSPSAVWSWNTKGEDLAVQVTHLQLYGHGIQRVRTWQYKWLTFGCMVMEYKGWGLGSTSDSPSAVWSWNTKGEDLAVQVTHLQLYGHGIQRVRTWQYKWLTFSCMVMEYKGWGLGSTSDSPSAVWSWNTKGVDLADE